MADVELSLVSKIVQTGSVEDALARGIEADHFVDPECKLLYETCVDHVRSYKTPPSLEAVQQGYLTRKRKENKDAVPFKFEVATDSLNYLIDQFIGVIKYRATVEATRDLAKRADDRDNWANLDLDALEIARNLAQVVPSSKTGVLSDVHKRIEEYERRKREGNPWGIRMGIPTFDQLTMGIQPHELVSIAGWQGTGKSTLMQYMLFNAYLQDRKPMLISLEMEAEALFRKWDTMATNLSYRAMKALELGEKDIKKWETWGEKAESAKADRDIIVIDDIGRCTVDKVFAETVRFSPDIVAVDYISLMDAPNNLGANWEKVTYNTKGLKYNARNLKVPVIALTQTNANDGGDGASLNNIAYSRSVGQDSDLVFGLHQKEEWREDKKMEVKLIKNRDGQQGEVMMHWEPSIMSFREFTLKETVGR